MKNTKKITAIVLFSIIGIMGCKKNNESNIPMVMATNPSNNATNVERNVTISCLFSEEMSPSTISTTTFTLKQGTTDIPGKVYYSGKTATFVPKNSLESNKVYTASMFKGAKNMEGNALLFDKIWNFKTGSTSKIDPVNLRSSANYVILAKTAINNSATSNVTGPLGLSPAATSYITGFALTDATGYATSAQVTGKIYAADMAAPTPINMTVAINDMVTAYNDAAGRVTPDFTEYSTGNIGGKTLTPGLYKWSNSVTMPSSVTISGGANDVWIFQIAGDLLMSSAANVTLIGGAQAKNIFWQVAGQVTLGSTAHLEGNILCMTGITFQTNASLFGRALAQTAVVLDANVLVKP